MGVGLRMCKVGSPKGKRTLLLLLPLFQELGLRDDVVDLRLGQGGPDLLQPGLLLLVQLLQILLVCAG